MAKWKTAFLPYFSNDADETLRVLAENGYDGVEWLRFLNFMSGDDLKEICAKTREKGLQVPDIMSGGDLVVLKDDARAERVQWTIDSIEMARDASVPIVNLTTGPADWGENPVKLGRDVTEGKAWDIVTEAFGKIVEAAEKNNVTVTVEAAFNNLVRDYYTLQEFLGRFDSKKLAVNMDPSHLGLVGNDVPWVVRKLGGKIKHVHVKDVFGKPGTQNQDFIFPLLGEGSIDWKGFFTALNDIGYDGYLSIEYESENYMKNVWHGDWTKVAKGSKEQLDALLQLAEV